MIKFLCLHGLHQNSKYLKKKLDPVFSKLNISFKCLEGPFNSTPSPIHKQTINLSLGHNNKNTFKSWFNDNENSLTHIAKIMKDNQDINGIFGFSEGASVASIISSNLFLQQYNLQHELKYLILVGGYINPNKIYHDYYSSGINLNTSIIHIIGDKDSIVTMNNSIKLHNYHKISNPNTSMIIHNRGHIIPTNILKDIKIE